jgi:hypothetical protein
MAQCSKCGKKLGFFESKKMFSDGSWMCAPCFKKLKVKEMEKELEKRGREILKGRAGYWGGHLLHPPNSLGDAGNFILTEKYFIFGKTSREHSGKIEIPLNKIIFKKISYVTQEDLAYKQRTTALAYFAGYGPITSYSRKFTCVVIPYKDERGVEQAPAFSFADQKTLEAVGKFFYEVMASKKDKKSNTSRDADIKSLF